MNISGNKIIKWFFTAVFIMFLSNPVHGTNLLRDFSLTLPLFSLESAWNQKADSASVLSGNDSQILALYRTLRGDVSGQYPATTTPATTWPYMDINYDSYSVAIFAAGTGTRDVLIRDYLGVSSINTSRLPTGTDGKITMPSSASTIRPAGPGDTDADGHLVLFDPTTYKEYDFWQATTGKDSQGKSLGGGQEGSTVLETGAIDIFNTRGPGVNLKGDSSARATGVPLLAGLILPEDFEKGEIAHALAVAIPGPRNTASSDPSNPSSLDYFYPVSTTETNFYNTAGNAPAAGQRLRLKTSLVDGSGAALDESSFSPATRIFLKALRTYGAIIVDNAGGFSFYAEDIHTGNLNLTDDQVNTLTGQASATPIPQGKTKWQVVLEKINFDLETIPFAYGPWQEGQAASTAGITTANFEFIAAATDPGSTRPTDLKTVETWMYQIQGLDLEGAVDTLKNTEYDLFVIEPGHNFNDSTYDTVSIINSLRYSPSGKKRLILAYIDIGQAEDYRDYWGSSWVAPTASSRGVPDFLVTIDPDGWSGNYPVAYWKSEWKKLWTDATGIIPEIAMFGFDGIYLDWVEAYDDTKISAVASQDNVVAQKEMIQFIEEMKTAGEAVTENFLVIPQNAPYLIDYDPTRYVSAIDGLAVEDTWFHGAGDAEWDDPDAGDLHERHDDQWSTANRLVQYKKYLDQNLPVFSVDYCISQTNADKVYQDAAADNLIPLVTRVSLSKLTVTPPPDLNGSTVDITGIAVSGTRQVGKAVTFTMATGNDNTSTIYYRFAMHPEYGTTSYDGTPWQSMTSSEYQTDNTCTYTFDTAGKYIVVVWAKDNITNSSIGVPIIGLSVDIAENTGNLSNCKVDITGIDVSGNLTKDNPVTFSITAQNSCSSDIYYRFSTHSGYGTSSYDGTLWKSMTNSVYQTDNTCTYTFDTVGKHIVVIWAKDNISDSDTGVPIIGLSVDIETSK